MEYVCTGATLKCTMGTTCPKLKATPKNVSLTGKDQANIADYVPGENIPSFGRCRSLAYPPTASATAANHGKLTPMPCSPGTCPMWKAIDKDSLVCGKPALLKPATLKCMYGGTISIVDPSQNKEVKAGGVIAESANDNRQNHQNHQNQKEYIVDSEDTTVNDKRHIDIDTMQTHSKDINDFIAEREKSNKKGVLTGCAASLALSDTSSANISSYNTSKKIDYQGKDALENWSRILNFKFKQPKESENASYDINKTIEGASRNYFSIGRGNVLASARVVVDVASIAPRIIYNAKYNEICGSAYPRIIKPIEKECIAGQKCNIQIVIENINDNMYYLPSGLECPKYGLLVRSFPNNLNVNVKNAPDKYLKIGKKGDEYAGTKKYVYENIKSITNVPIELQSGQTYLIRAYLCAVDLMGYICSYSDTLIIKMIEK